MVARLQLTRNMSTGTLTTHTQRSRRLSAATISAPAATSVAPSTNDAISASGFDPPSEYNSSTRSESAASASVTAPTHAAASASAPMTVAARSSSCQSKPIHASTVADSLEYRARIDNGVREHFEKEHEREFFPENEFEEAGIPMATGCYNWDSEHRGQVSDLVEGARKEYIDSLPREKPGRMVSISDYPQYQAWIKDGGEEKFAKEHGLERFPEDITTLPLPLFQKYSSTLDKIPGLCEAIRARHKRDWYTGPYDEEDEKIYDLAMAMADGCYYGWDNEYEDVISEGSDTDKGYWICEDSGTSETSDVQIVSGEREKSNVTKPAVDIILFHKLGYGGWLSSNFEES